MSDSVSVALSAARKIRKPKQTVDEPQRNAFPGVYQDPRVIAEEAASRVAPESLAMKRLFGVTRDELYEMGAGRKGSAEPKINTKPGATGSIAADRLMNPKNARRLQDILHEAGRYRDLQRGMDAWYNMDPVLERLKALVGPEKAPAHYSRLNTMIGLMSPGSEVNTEIDRGLAAHHLYHQGKIDQFIEKGGLPEGKRGPDFPQEISRMKGHPYHSTSQAGPLKKYLERGEITSDAPKVPLYVQASEAHETGNQTRLPVPDAHFTRALGMADTRGGESSPGVSMRMAEYQPVGPWFRDKVAKQVGLEAVPAQARLWGAASGQTGVTTKIGAPKLELLANHIMAVARHHKIEPEIARDLVLTGKIYFRGGRVERADGGAVNQEPTEAQKMVGNYRKQHISFQGLPISIENPKGSIRKGPGWQVRVPYDYGYIKRTQGADGDHVDVCIGPDATSDHVFVIDQQDHRTGSFDEHKCMLGYRSKPDAIEAYCKGFSDGKGPARMKSIVRMTMPEFKVWLKHCDTKKPVRGQGHIERALAQTPVYASTQTSSTETKK